MVSDAERDAAEASVRAAFASGAAMAAATIVRAYGAELRGYLVATARDRDAGEELFQELSEELLRSLPRFRGESSFRTYSYAIAYNLVRRHKKRAARRRAEPLDEEAAERVPAPVRTETRSWLRTDARERVAALRDRLSTEERTLLFLRFERAMSWKEVARVLENDESTAMAASVRKRHERLLRKLRAWIRE